MAETALAGLRIVVTRPRDQAGPLSRQIEAHGGTALTFPLLDIAPVPQSAALQLQLERAVRADLLIFISPNAVNYGLALLKMPLPSCRIAAVGQGSARILREHGITEMLVPSDRFDSEGMLALPALQQVAGWKITIFRGDSGRELLGDTLRERGAEVEYLGCYLRSPVALDTLALQAAQPDALTVSSSEAVDHMSDALADFPALRALPVFAPHLRIAARARERGCEQVIETATGDDGLLRGLVAWAALRKKHD
jgi:uroporphyrinogen-III synthase